MNKLKMKFFANKQESKKDQLNQFLKLSEKEKKEFVESWAHYLAEQLNQEYKPISVKEYKKMLSDSL